MGRITNFTSKGFYALYKNRKGNVRIIISDRILERMITY
jgi:hypothetical protein